MPPLTKGSTPIKSTRKRLTIHEKVKIIENSLRGLKNVELAIKYGIPESTICKLIKDKQSILKIYEKYTQLHS